eukprot:m.519126 g.519126  ORF g.519126 m.519126 type:complete len:250 (+) comp21943_c0_seq28:2078-2827(+)
MSVWMYPCTLICWCVCSDTHGGAFFSTDTGIGAGGNMGPWTEANAGYDPEACHIVLSSPIPKTMYTWDVYTQVGYTLQDMEALGIADTDAALATRATPHKDSSQGAVVGSTAAGSTTVDPEASGVVCCSEARRQRAMCMGHSRVALCRACAIQDLELPLTGPFAQAPARTGSRCGIRSAGAWRVVQCCLAVSVQCDKVARPTLSKTHRRIQRTPLPHGKSLLGDCCTASYDTGRTQTRRSLAMRARWPS